MTFSCSAHHSPIAHGDEVRPQFPSPCLIQYLDIRPACQGALEELLGHCEHEDADGRVVALDDASRSRILAAGTAMNEEACPPRAWFEVVAHKRCDPRAQSLAAGMTCLTGKRGKLATLGPQISAAVFRRSVRLG